MRKDYAEVLLACSGFSMDQGQLECTEVTSDLLFEIAKEYPELYEKNSGLYREYAGFAWYSKYPYSNRPDMPKGWWPGDRTLGPRDLKINLTEELSREILLAAQACNEVFFVPGDEWTVLLENIHAWYPGILSTPLEGRNDE